MMWHIKMTEHCRESEILTVYHIGEHRHLPKSNTKQYRSLIQEAVLKNNGLGASTSQQIEVGKAFMAGDNQEAQR